MQKLIFKFSMTVCCAFIIAIITGAGNCAAQVLFSDDFRSWPDYNFAKDSVNPPGGWSYLDGNPSSTIGGITHYAGEVSTPGRLGASDRSFKIWRNNSFVKNYSSELYYHESSLVSNKTIYVRWYMKIPTNFEVTNMNYLKMWRWRINSKAGINGNAIYIDFTGNLFSGSSMAITKFYPTGGWSTLTSTSSIRDGQWHCHEVMIKLNTNGKSDGEIKYWLDGVQKKNITGCNWEATSGDGIASTSLGVGNTAGTFQNFWQAIEFDDYVVSTSYIGPSGSSSSSSSASSSSAPPPPPGVPWVVK